ncbi:alpha/beta hydrolase [Terrimonas sp. R1]
MKFQFFYTKFLFAFVVIACGCKVRTKQLPGDFIIHYPYANDSFLVRVTDLTTNVRAQDTIHFVYYVDASLKSGKQMEQMIGKYKLALGQKRYVFVGIAHFGYFRSKRRRDFISPSLKTEKGFKGRNGNYGQADTFYHLLKNKIAPKAEEKFSGHPVKRSFIGHSLGGLFATYLLTNNDSLFSNLYALSPSLWIDDYHILDYENLQKSKLMNISKDIWISCGSAETLNKIRNAVKKMEDTLKARKYPGISYSIRVYSGETHNSSVQPALNEIFEGF